jgi:hypothetical protein
MRFIFLPAGICLAVGCINITASHPLYFAREKTFDPRLLGDWEVTQERGDKTSCTVEKAQVGGRNGYLVRGEKAEDDVKARLVSIRGKFYLDIQEAEQDEGHTIGRLCKEDNGFAVQLLDSDFVKNYLHEHPCAVAHNANDDVLTAKTRGLRKFIWKLERCPEAWQTFLWFHRPANVEGGNRAGEKKTIEK